MGLTNTFCFKIAADVGDVETDTSKVDNSKLNITTGTLTENDVFTDIPESEAEESEAVSTAYL